jgi:hypothetical protein
MRRHPFAHVTAALLLGSALFASGPARSQSAPAGIETSQSADAFFQTGKDLYKAGKLQEAYEAYRSAWSLKHTHDIAANLANSESQLGKMRDAAEHLAFCVRYFPPSGSKAQLERLKGHFEAARREVGAAFIQVNVEGGEVLVDGVSIGRVLPTDEIYLDPGARTIEVKLKGYETAKQVVKVAKGPTQTVTLSLAAVAPTPIALVAPAASSSAGPLPLPSGSAQAPDPLAQKGPSKPVLITGGVVTGLAIVAGVVFTVIANGKATDAEAKAGEVLKSGGGEACGSAPGCTELHGLLSDRGTFSDAALWTFVGAGVLGVGTAVYALTAPRTTSKTGLRAAPMVSTSGGGIVLGGAW